MTLKVVNESSTEFNLYAKEWWIDKNKWSSDNSEHETILKEEIHNQIWKITGFE